MLKYEMRRAFGKFFWIAFLVGVVSGSGGFVSYLLDSEYLPAQSISCFDALVYCVSVGEGSFYRAIYPIVICLPYIFTFIQIRTVHLYISSYPAKVTEDYLKNKCFSGCISTISLVLGVNIVWLIVAYILFPANKPITIFNLQMGGIYNWLYPIVLWCTYGSKSLSLFCSL